MHLVQDKRLPDLTVYNRSNEARLLLNRVRVAVMNNPDLNEAKGLIDFLSYQDADIGSKADFESMAIALDSLTETIDVVVKRLQSVARAYTCTTQ